MLLKLLGNKNNFIDPTKRRYKFIKATPWKAYVSYD